MVKQPPGFLRGRPRLHALRWRCKISASWHSRPASWQALWCDSWQGGVQGECQLSAHLVEAGQKLLTVALDEPLQYERWLETQTFREPECVSMGCWCFTPYDEKACDAASRKRSFVISGESCFGMLMLTNLVLLEGVQLHFYPYWDE